MSENGVNTYLAETSSATESFAERMGAQLKGGEVIELIGDVGAGKTTFVRGLARGAGSLDRVSSPTFTVSKIYTSQNVTIVHYDFYRLDDVSIMQNELAEALENEKTTIVMEWAEEVQDVLPNEHIILRFKSDGADTRQIESVIPAEYSYIGVAA